MSYILILCTVALALFSLYKDWNNYKHPRARKAVGVILLMVGTLSIIKQSRDSRDAQMTRTKATADINTLKSEVAGLQGEVKAANAAQTQNTKVFLETLNRLSDKVRELQTKAETEDLRKQLASVQNDLKRDPKGARTCSESDSGIQFLPLRESAVR
jgi:uncharacterized alpha-E superfamily protein